MYSGGDVGGAKGATMVTPFFLGTGAEPGVGRAAAAEGEGGGVWPVVQAARQAMAPIPRAAISRPPSTA